MPETRVLKNKIKHLKSKKKKSAKKFSIRFYAIFEIVIFLATMVIISYAFSDGSRFIDISPHPFWIIILLVSLQYGVKEALLAVILSSIVLSYDNFDKNMYGDIYKYWQDISFRPTIWAVTAVIISSWVNKYKKNASTLEKKISSLRNKNDILLNAYNKMQQTKEGLETRIAREMSSAITIYETAKSLDKLDGKNLLPIVEDIVVATMQPNKFSVLLLTKNGLEPGLYHGWEKDDTYKKSFNINSEIYKHIISQKRVISIINSDDERILSGEGIIAGPLINKENGEVFGILKIESIAFGKLSIRTIETFRILCEWIGMAYTNTAKFGDVQKDSIINYDYMIFSHRFFEQQRNFLLLLAKRMAFDLTILNIKINKNEQLSHAEIRTRVEALKTAINNSLRNTDQAFKYDVCNEKFAIILPGASLKNAEKILNKISKYIEKNDNMSNNYDFSIEQLHTIESSPIEDNSAQTT